MKTFIILLFVSLLITGCSKQSSKNLMQLGEKNITSQKYADAVKNFEKIVKEFPESKDAPKALMQLAVIYQNKKIPNIDAKISIEKSANYFKEVFDKYPNSKEASRALFMAGFIQANVLHNYNIGKKIYQLFLNRYPKNELANSVREEIKNLGVSADKIIERNTKKKI